MNSFPTHNRNTSQGQQLIVDRNESYDEELNGEKSETSASPSHPSNSLDSADQTYEARLRSTDVYPSPADGPFCRDARIRDNWRVVVGSVLLTILGAAFLIAGAVEIIFPGDGSKDFRIITVLSLFQCIKYNGWVFLFAGSLAFIPGIYHVVYIICHLCGCPGYSFNNLPTFNS
ncbi:unnamed protein product [Anisakis simplex]|uniref:Transmembrane protein n=1 Tax=Anisakis simplex TaxID=6269 RepID=A0A0M3J1T6_ANISI|nr:unnamed protein product [Anisakis simplex]